MNSMGSKQRWYSIKCSSTKTCYEVEERTRLEISKLMEKQMETKSDLSSSTSGSMLFTTREQGISKDKSKVIGDSNQVNKKTSLHCGFHDIEINSIKQLIWMINIINRTLFSIIVSSRTICYIHNHLDKISS